LPFGISPQLRKNELADFEQIMDYRGVCGKGGEERGGRGEELNSDKNQAEW
jgi:hypothetical protein